MARADLLDAIFDAERSLRRAETELLGNDPKDVAGLLSAAVDEAATLTDRKEAILRLYRLADLCAQVPGPKMADALLRILDDDDPAVRQEAGEALLDVGYQRYAEVARAIERALDSGHDGPSMEELPYILAEIAEPSAVPLISRFAEHPNASVVAAAVEAFAELGDPGALDILERLTEDGRDVSIDDGSGEAIQATVGELAAEAAGALRAAGGGE